MQVVAANRKRCATVLNAVLDDLPAQTAKQAKQATAEEEMEAFLVHVRALKRQAKLEKREAERKEAAEALATSEAAGGALSGGAAAAAATGRVRRTASKHANAAHASDEDDDDEESEDEVGGVPLPLAGTSLVDPYALEVPDAINALCAVCGDGESKGNDQIVFCDRCNVAVHQQCYGVGEIPQGDWLCWPCKMYALHFASCGKACVTPANQNDVHSCVIRTAVLNRECIKSYMYFGGTVACCGRIWGRMVSRSLRREGQLCLHAGMRTNSRPKARSKRTSGLRGSRKLVTQTTLEGQRLLSVSCVQ